MENLVVRRPGVGCIAWLGVDVAAGQRWSKVSPEQSRCRTAWRKELERKRTRNWHDGNCTRSLEKARAQKAVWRVENQSGDAVPRPCCRTQAARRSAEPSEPSRTHASENRRGKIGDKRRHRYQTKAPTNLTRTRSATATESERGAEVKGCRHLESGSYCGSR